MADRVPVLLDTDIGSDIDDAVALAYLLREPCCELVGVTTVTGDVAKRAALAEVLCRAAGQPDVPVHAGCEHVLLTGPGQPDVPQYEVIADVPHRLDRDPGTAVAFMRRTIRERPGEIVLLTIGPLTNVALLFAIDPEIPSLLAGMTSMAGRYFDPLEEAEWNCAVDPAATTIAFSRSPIGHVCVGLDVTRRCRLGAADVRERFVDPPLDLVARMADVWFRDREHVTFHDPLATAVLFEPGLCDFEEGTVDVTFEEFEGRTIFTPGEPARHRVARDVRSDAFFARFFSTFAA